MLVHSRLDFASFASMLYCTTRRPFFTRCGILGLKSCLFRPVRPNRCSVPRVLLQCVLHTIDSRNELLFVVGFPTPHKCTALSCQVSSCDVTVYAFQIHIMPWPDTSRLDDETHVRSYVGIQNAYGIPHLLPVVAVDCGL